MTTVPDLPFDNRPEFIVKPVTEKCPLCGEPMVRLGKLTFDDTVDLGAGDLWGCPRVELHRG